MKHEPSRGSEKDPGIKKRDMTSGHISLFWFLGCRRFWNRVENSRSKMAEPSGPCSDVEGTVKVDILKFPKGIGKPPNRPSGRRRFCAVQAFWPKAKTLAQAEFTSAEHLKSTGWRPPPAAGTQKRRTSDRMSFFFGTPGATRTHYIPLRSMACRFVHRPLHNLPYCLI